MSDIDTAAVDSLKALDLERPIREAVFGLTPSKYQSGEINRTGAISKCGDEMMRVMLYEAAQSMLVHSARWSWLKAWAMKIARHRGMKKAIVALARRLAVIMHRIWVDGTEFRWTREAGCPLLFVHIRQYDNDSLGPPPVASLPLRVFRPHRTTCFSPLSRHYFERR